MMQNDAQAAQIVGIVSEVLGTPVTGGSSISDVDDWDSLKTLQIVMALDEAGYEIPLEKIAEIGSVGSILSFVKKRN
jgi:acyl carrier protein